MFRYFLFLGLLAVAGAACANEPEAGAQAMSAGVGQFRDGHYQAARAQFETALNLGIDTPALRYNLGVACYKTGDYKAAQAHFSELLNGPNQALARYNLGLVALADGRVAEARQWFLLASAEDAPDAIRELAARQLSEPETSDTSPQQNHPAITQGYLSIGAGYDSNMAGVPDDSPSNRGSAFAELVAAGTLSHGLSRDWRLVWDGVFYGQDYSRSSGYDTLLLQSRLATVHTLDAWELGLRGGGSRAWLADDELETRLGLALFARTDECPRVYFLDGCALELAADQVSGGPGYKAYDGQWYQFEARGERGFAGLVVEGFYRWQRNNRENFRQDDYVVNVSPSHQELGLEAFYPLRSNLIVGAETALRHSRYDAPHQWFEQGVLTVRRREDVRMEFGLMAEFYLTRQWLVRNRWLVRDQSSRIDRYDYQRHTLTVSLEGLF